MPQWSLAEVSQTWGILGTGAAAYVIYGPERKAEKLNVEHLASFIEHLLSNGWEPLSTTESIYGAGTTSTMEKGKRTWSFKKMVE